MGIFSKKFLEEFIEVFKDHPALWDAKSEEYKNGYLRNKGWNALLNKYKEVDKTANVETAKRKINVLRASYRRELGKVIGSRQDGCGSNYEYVPNLWYFDLLDFLRDHTFKKEPKRSLEDPLEMQEVQKLMGDSFNNFSVIQQEPKEEEYTDSFEESLDEEKLCSFNKSQSAEDYSQAKKLENCDNSNQESVRDEADMFDEEDNFQLIDCENLQNQSVRDEADVFAEGWAIIYRQLKADQKIFAKRIIDEALMLGQFEQLTFNTIKCLDSIVPINLQAVRHETPPPSSTLSSQESSD